MKGVRLSLLYQYFDAKERILNEQIERLEHLTTSYMDSGDIIRLIELKAKRDALQTVFKDLYKFIVDFDKDFE